MFDLRRTDGGHGGGRVIQAMPVALLAAVLVSAASASPPSGAPLQSFPVTDGDVNAMALAGSTLYIGGSFTSVGPNTVGFAAVDTGTAKPDTSIPTTDGKVYATLADGAGGWYLGGQFSKVGNVARSNLAHILPNGEVDLAFDPSPDAEVHALVLSGDGATLYAGGNFGEIGGAQRACVAALNTATGQATSFDASATAQCNAVYALALSSDEGTLYAGGQFFRLGGEARASIAALSTASGSATAFNPGDNGFASVYALALSSDDQILYLGGDFTTLGGQTRTALAAVQTSGSGSVVSSFNPNAFSSDGNQTVVDALALSSGGAMLYAAGHFTQIGGQARRSIAALSTANGTSEAFDPNPSSTLDAGPPRISTLALSNDDSTLYAAGRFTSIGGASRFRLAALDTADGTATSFDAGNTIPVSTQGTNVLFHALALSGSTLGVGGEFTSIGVQARNDIAAIDLATGDVTSFAPDANGTVETLILSGSTLYVGGQFTTIGGQTRHRIAALSTADGTADSSFDPDANNTVATLALSSDGSTLYAGGRFGSIGGQSIGWLAALSTADGTADPAFDPAANEGVSGLALSSDDATLYAAGSFTSIGGQPRNRIAALSTANGTATSFNPDANSVVNQLALSSNDSTLYAVGGFTEIGGQPRNNIAALATSSGNATPFDPNSNNYVNSLALSSDDSTLYVVGDFTAVGGASRSRVAGVSTVDGTATSFNPNVDDYTASVELSPDDSTLYVGGSFSNVGGGRRPHLAVFPKFPATTIDSGPANPLPKGATATFTFSSDTGGATFECRLDSANFSACSSPQSYPNLSSGAHRFSVRAVAGGLKDPFPPTYTWTVLSADGSGAMTGSPTAVSAFATNQTIKFTYTAAIGGLSGGEVRLTVPSGWSVPSTTGTEPGFVTSSTGTVSISSRTIVVSGISRVGGQQVTITYGSRASGGPGATAPSTTGAQTWPAQAKSSTGGTLQPLASSPSVTVYARDGSGTLTSSKTEVSALWMHQTIKFTYTTAAGGIAGGQLRITVPSGWSAPSTNDSAAGYTTASPGSVSISNRTIIVSGLTRSAGQQVTVTYGSRTLGGPGATAPSTTGLQLWLGQEKSTPSGTVKSLGSSPSISVYARDGSGTLTTPTTSVVHGSTGRTITFTYTTATGGMKGGQVTLAVPAGWSAPSTSGSARGFVKASLGTVSISSRTIVVSGLTRAGGEKFTITYGSKAAGGPGASAPLSAVGTQTWQAKQKSLPGGVLTNLGSSPKITVT